MFHNTEQMKTAPNPSFYAPDIKKMEFLGAELARLLKTGDILALYGELGAGKTTLVRGIIQHLLGDGTDIPSPTYTLLQTYDSEIGQICHFDLYRLETPDEIQEIGFEDALDEICLIEWPDKAGEYLPKARLSVKIAPEDTGRRITFIPGTQEWEDRLNEHFGSTGT